MGQAEDEGSVAPTGLAALLSKQDKQKVKGIFSPIKPDTSSKSHDSPHREPSVKPWVAANLMAKRAAIQRVHKEREARKLRAEIAERKRHDDEMRARKEKAAEERREAKRVAQWQKAAKQKENTVKKAVAKATKMAKQKAEAELQKFQIQMEKREENMRERASNDAQKQIQFELQQERILKAKMDHRMQMTSKGDKSLNKAKANSAGIDAKVFTEQFFEYAHPFPDLDPLVKARPERPASPSVISIHRHATKKKAAKAKTAAKEKTAQDQRLEAFEKSVTMGRELLKTKNDNQEANRRNIEKVHTVDLQQKEHMLAVTLDHMKVHADSEIGLIKNEELRKEKERLDHIANWEVEQTHRRALEKALLKEEHRRAKANKKAKKVASSRKAKRTAQEWEFFESSVKMAQKERKSRSKDEEQRQRMSDSRAMRKQKLVDDGARQRAEDEAAEAKYQAEMERRRREQVQEDWQVHDRARARMLDLAKPNDPKSYAVNESRVAKAAEEKKKSVEFRKISEKRGDGVYKFYQTEEARLIDKWKTSTVEREKSMTKHLKNKQKVDVDRLSFLKAEGKKRDDKYAEAKKKMAQQLAFAHQKAEADLKADQEKSIAAQRKAAKHQKDLVENMHKNAKESERKFAMQKAQRDKDREDLKLKLAARIAATNKAQIKQMMNPKPYEIPEEARPKKLKPFQSPYKLEKSHAAELTPYQHYVGPDRNTGNAQYFPPRPDTR
jgi:hypothetical protein